MVDVHNSDLVTRSGLAPDEEHPPKTGKSDSTSFLVYFRENHGMVLTLLQESIVEKILKNMESRGEVDIIDFELQLMLSKDPEFSISQRSMLTNTLDQYLLTS